MFRGLVIATSMVALTLSSAACATKKFVRTSVGEVNEKADALGRSVEQTQERTRQNETKIAEADQKAQQAGTAAANAQSAADRANGSATTAASSASAASAKVEEIDRASKRLVMEVVLRADQGGFTNGSRELPDSVKTGLDELIAKLQADPKAAFFEIEGHTDSAGDAAVNERLGLERAEMVKRYLYEKYRIPLHKMNTVSYGEAKPVGDNKTRDGRAQNRRVVVRVIA